MLTVARVGVRVPFFIRGVPIGFLNRCTAVRRPVFFPRRLDRIVSPVVSLFSIAPWLWAVVAGAFLGVSGMFPGVSYY